MWLRVLIPFAALLAAGISSAQEAGDDLTTPPVVQEFVAEDEGGEAYESDLWISPIFVGTTGAVNEYLRRGHVYSAVDFAAVSVSHEAFETDGDFVITPRAYLGWESETGFGVRGRYWTYQEGFSHTSNSFIAIHEQSPGQINTSIHVDYDDLIATTQYLSVTPQEYEAESLELEVYQRIIAGNSRIMLGVGLRDIEKDSAV